ncbi:MAG: helix-turn-helix domain-containing protein [Xanthomonadales bacterium]|nr:helix-turn-helix domain-containing protein [Xanthomonadales bacterium]MCB1634415.1 helix-turn-helix domain-containing protein [Xanthomonadales bacterium]
MHSETRPALSNLADAISEVRRPIASNGQTSFVSSTCSVCTSARLCLPHGLDEQRLREFECLVDEVGPLHAGDFIFRDGDSFGSLYAVRAGMIKTYSIDREGREQITGFFLPGELVGLDAVHVGHFRSHAVALDTSMVCRMSFPRVNELSRRWPELQRELLGAFSRGLAEADKLRGDFSADERVAAFLVDLARRLESRGFSAKRLYLLMERRDIANFLGMAKETISRVLRRMQDDGLIAVDRREVQLLQRPRLDEMASAVLRD